MKIKFKYYLKSRILLVGFSISYLLLLLMNRLNWIDWMPSCWIKSKFGVECWGCGTNRAFLSLLEGNVIESVQQNPLAILLIVLMIIFFIKDFSQFQNKQNEQLCKI